MYKILKLIVVIGIVSLLGGCSKGLSDQQTAAAEAANQLALDTFCSADATLFQRERCLTYVEHRLLAYLSRRWATLSFDHQIQFLRSIGALRCQVSPLLLEAK